MLAESVKSSLCLIGVIFVLIKGEKENKITGHAGLFRGIENITRKHSLKII